MAGCSGPGPIGSESNVPCIDPGTSARAQSAAAGSVGLTTSVSRGQARLRFPVVETFAYQFGWVLGSGKELTYAQRQVAREVFGESIDLDVVRIIETSLTPEAPVTLGNYIRTRSSLSDRILIHELTHVWQFQNGGAAYISDSAVHQVCAALSAGSRDAAYDLTGVVVAGKTFSQYTAEQQAMIVETFYSDPGKRSDPIYQKLLAEVRARRPLPQEERWLEIYQDGLSGPSGTGEFWPPQRPGEEFSTVMPFLRIEF